MRWRGEVKGPGSGRKRSTASFQNHGGAELVKSLEKKVRKLKRRLRDQKRDGDSGRAKSTKRKIRKLQKRIGRLG